MQTFAFINNRLPDLLPLVNMLTQVTDVNNEIRHWYSYKQAFLTFNYFNPSNVPTLLILFG